MGQSIHPHQKGAQMNEPAVYLLKYINHLFKQLHGNWYLLIIATITGVIRRYSCLYLALIGRTQVNRFCINSMGGGRQTLFLTPQSAEHTLLEEVDDKPTEHSSPLHLLVRLLKELMYKGNVFEGWY